MSKLTKAELEKKLKTYMEQATNADFQRGKLEDRNVLAGRYLQVLRAMNETLGGDILMKQIDFDRVLDVLEQDRHLEGF